MRGRTCQSAASRRRPCRRSSSRSCRREIVEQHQAAESRRACVPHCTQAGAGGADRGAPQAAGGQEARRRDYRRRRRAHHQGIAERNKMTIDQFAAARQIDGRRHHHHARALRARAGLARGHPPQVRRPDHRRQTRRRPHAVGGRHRSRRGRRRAAGPEDHAAAAGPGRPDRAGPALHRGRALRGKFAGCKSMAELAKASPTPGSRTRSSSSRAACPSRRARCC